ncbi:MAG: hypothetical protein K9J17_07905 [Flavobacteriales bacterium]|nr:hypothetical protein [Flavobacteriales bacterium]
MKNKAVQIFLLLFVGVFVFNQVADLVHLHRKDTGSYCCETNEVEEIVEFGSRLRTHDSHSLLLYAFQFNYFSLELLNSENSVLTSVGSRAFFPHAMHVPIYLEKRNFLI